MSNRAVGLRINGIVVPPDFPREPFELIHEVLTSISADQPAYLHFSGAWGAVAYRYRGAVESGEEFLVSLDAHGSSPKPEERFIQEKALFEFFSSGFSVFEASFYAAFAIGAIVAPDMFPIAAETDQQRISPTTTKAAFRRAFMGDSILEMFDGIFNDPRYQQWREIRNVLTHRSAPGRRFYVSIGSDDAPPTAWSLKNLPLNAALVSSERTELSRLLRTFTDGLATFVTSKLKN
jgi:hypothetical protein